MIQERRDFPKMALDVPVAGGEQDNDPAQWRRMIALRAVDVVPPDICSVGGLTRTLARLKQNGVAPVKEPCRRGGNSYRVLVKDPDGDTVELIGPRQ